MIERLFAYVPGGTVMPLRSIWPTCSDVVPRPRCWSYRSGWRRSTASTTHLIFWKMQALARALQPSEREQPERWIPTYILIALTSRHDLTRLQVVLELGAGYGIAGLLLGHWRLVSR